MERGLNSCRNLRYNKKANVGCDKNRNRYRNDLGIADVKTAYIILCLGYCLSILILGIEIFVRSFGEKIRRRRIAQGVQWGPN